MKRKPKPATAGEKIARSIWFVASDKQAAANASRIDRAIARAVRKERTRCVTIIDACSRGLIGMSRADEMIENGE